MVIDPEVYRTARSPRPRWANLLILALVALLSGTFALATSLSIVLVCILLAASGLLLIAAGITALLVGRPS
jgi:hypothetical protein